MRLPLCHARLLVELNVPHTGFRHVSEFMTRLGGVTGCLFPRSIPTRDKCLDTWKEMA